MVYKRLLTGLFICLCSFLLMSHNANALSFGSAEWRTYRLDRTAVNVTNNEYTSYDLPTSQMSLLNSGLNISIPTNTIRVNNIHLGLNDYSPNKYLASVPYRFCPVNPDNLTSWIGFAGSSRNAVISQKWIINGSCLSGDVLVYGDLSARVVDLGLGDANGVNIGYIAAGGTIVFNSVSFITLTDDADYSSVLNAIKNNTDDIKSKLDEIADSADAALDREESETQDAADASSSAGSSAASSSQQATSSLLSTITGFFNAIIGVNPSNCKFNSNLPFLPGNGEIDLCSISTPPIVQTLSSLVLVGLFIPFCIHMFNRFVSITESFQR